MLGGWGPGGSVTARRAAVVGVVAAVAVLASAILPPAAAARSGVAAGSCSPRILVLSAFPAELGPIFDATAPTSPALTAEGRVFYPRRIAGQAVLLAMTGIGPVNARRTIQAALDHFRCGTASAIKGVVFSGVAGGGGPSAIGDVTVPYRWTLDGGRTWTASDARMLATARRVAPSVKLERRTPAGDPACTCLFSPHLIKTVAMKRQPRTWFGGDGLTTDPFGGRAVPCAPGGGDLTGCQPCHAARAPAAETQRLLAGLPPLLDPAFLRGLTAPSSSGQGYIAADEETAAVARIAAANRVPFIGFRAVSDGAGDPLMLPGFPWQFFVYKQLAADNAAAVALAFLRAWRG